MLGAPIDLGRIEQDIYAVGAEGPALLDRLAGHANTVLSLAWNEAGTRLASASVDEIVATLVREHQAGDLVVLMSNGGFGGIHKRLLAALAPAAPPR